MAIKNSNGIRQTKPSRVAKIRKAALANPGMTKEERAPYTHLTKEQSESSPGLAPTFAETREEKRELYQLIAQAPSVDVLVRCGDSIWHIKNAPPNPHILRALGADYERTQ